MDDALHDELLRIYAQATTIAVIGASATPGRAAHDVPEHLHVHGYRILPITPRASTLFGEATRASLAELTEVPDIVEVFRRRRDRVGRARRDRVGREDPMVSTCTETPEAVRLAEDAGMRVFWGNAGHTRHRARCWVCRARCR